MTRVWIAAVLGAVIAVLAVATYRFWPGGERGAGVVDRQAVGRVLVGAETKSVVLFFAADDGEGMVRETREIIAGGGLETEMKRTLEALARGPQGGGSATLPLETTVEGIWLDSRGCLYVDMGRELRAFHGGGSSAERMTICSILRTVGVNFPKVRSVRFLEEGQPMETLAGHLDLGRALWVDDWRPW